MHANVFDFAQMLAKSDKPYIEFLRVPSQTGVDWKAVGRRLRQLRGFEMNQAAFAREIGISQSQLSRYEKGKSEIGAEILLRMAKKFGKSMEWLLTGEE